MASVLEVCVTSNASAIVEIRAGDLLHPGGNSADVYEDYRIAFIRR